jgi:hypothetical protein
MDIERIFIECVHLTKNQPGRFEFLKTANYLIGQII